MWDCLSSLLTTTWPDRWIESFVFALASLFLRCVDTTKCLKMLLCFKQAFVFKLLCVFLYDALYLFIVQLSHDCNLALLLIFKVCLTAVHTCGVDEYFFIPQHVLFNMHCYWFISYSNILKNTLEKKIWLLKQGYLFFLSTV